MLARAAQKIATAQIVSAALLARELKEWLSSMTTLTSLSIGKAAAYTLGKWPKLIRFVDDARIPLDNNATERGIRGPVVGCRNHFGSKSRGAAPRSPPRCTPSSSRPRSSTTSAAYLHAAIVAADCGELLLPAQFAAQRAVARRAYYACTAPVTV